MKGEKSSCNRRIVARAGPARPGVMLTSAMAGWNECGQKGGLRIDRPAWVGRWTWLCKGRHCAKRADEEQHAEPEPGIGPSVAFSALKASARGSCGVRWNRLTAAKPTMAMNKPSLRIPIGHNRSLSGRAVRTGSSSYSQSRSPATRRRTPPREVKIVSWRRRHRCPSPSDPHAGHCEQQGQCWQRNQAKPPPRSNAGIRGQMRGTGRAGAGAGMANPGRACRSARHLRPFAAAEVGRPKHQPAEQQRQGQPHHRDQPEAGFRQHR